MVRFEDWQKYLDEQISDAHRRRKEQQSAPEDEALKPDPVIQDVRAVLLGAEKDSKKVKEEIPSPDSGESANVDSSIEKTPFPFRFANPAAIILQKDKGGEETARKDEKIAQIEDPVAILTQKDKKSRSVSGIKEPPSSPPGLLQNLYSPRQIELPLEGLPPEKETKVQSFMEKRERLLRGLLDPKITLTEAAMILAVPKETLLQFADEKLLPCHRSAGSHIYFKLSDVLAFLEDRRDILKINPHEIEKILTEQDEFEAGHGK